PRCRRCVEIVFFVPVVFDEPKLRSCPGFSIDGFKVARELLSFGLLAPAPETEFAAVLKECRAADAHFLPWFFTGDDRLAALGRTRGQANSARAEVTVERRILRASLELSRLIDTLAARILPIDLPWPDVIPVRENHALPRERIRLPDRACVIDRQSA